MPALSIRARQQQQQSFHDVLYSHVLQPVADHGKVREATERASSTKAAILNGILNSSPRPPKGNAPNQRLRKYPSAFVAAAQSRQCWDSPQRVRAMSSAPPLIHAATKPEERLELAAEVLRGKISENSNIRNAGVQTTAEPSLVEKRTAVAQKCADAAGHRAMRIRAEAGNVESSWAPTPVIERSSTASSYHRVGTASSMRSSRGNTSTPPACMSPFLTKALSELVLLPCQLLFKIALWLPPLEVVNLVTCHSALSDIREDLAAWVSREVHGVDHRLIQAVYGVDEFPAMRIHHFARRQAQAAMRAQSQLLAAGLQHSVVVRRGVALSWGAASSGQLGRGSPAQQIHPIPTSVSLSHAVTMVACGGDHSLLVASNKSVWAFGRNADGQLGTGGTKDSARPVDMLVPPASQVACGADHSLVLGIEGSVWACGRGTEGQLGIDLPNDAQGVLKPAHVMEAAHLVACGADHSVVLDRVGRAFSFGENSKGQLGLGHCRSQHRPAQMHMLPGSLFVSADCGGTHTLLVADDSKVYGCGSNDQGQLGSGPPEDVLSPDVVLLRAPSTICRAQRVSCGFSHSLALTGSGSLWVLGGRKHSGELSNPWRVRGFFDRTRVEDAAAGGSHVLSMAAGSVFTFDVGSIGHDDSDERSYNPTPKRVAGV
jgi:hypothetical protein